MILDHPSPVEILATVCFALAVIHTFLTSSFRAIAKKFPEGSISENFFHMVGEVEVVFGIWAGLFLLGFALLDGPEESIRYLESRNFSEAIFVFAVLVCCGTRPILESAERGLMAASRFLIFDLRQAFFFVCLFLGPLLGSFISEPAAMTVVALLLNELYFKREVSARFKYITLGVLFVNVSIGGVLTSYAAPPVLMVASIWNFDSQFMFMTFGWKAISICFVNAIFALWLLRKEFRHLDIHTFRSPKRAHMPLSMILIHFVFLGGLVFFHRHASLVIGMFLFLLGFLTISKEYQSELKLRESLLVAFFLAGLVVLGGMQAWWLGALIRDLNSTALFFGATGLTAIADNAALTYLGAQIPDVSDTFKYALVAGAVTGGGLTVIANAPNPAGYSILQGSFGSEGIKPIKLLGAALIPTIVAASIFWGFH